MRLKVQDSLSDTLTDLIWIGQSLQYNIKVVMCADVIIEINDLLYLTHFAVFTNNKNVKYTF